MQRLPRDAPDRTIRQYAQWFAARKSICTIYSRPTDCWAVRAKIRQKQPSRWPY